MSIAGKIIFISNRNVRPGRDDIELFGEDLNDKAAEELNLASAEYLEQEARWKFQLLTDPAESDPENPVSRQLFREIIDLSANGEQHRQWVLFIHGFNQSIEKNLQKCREIASYGVNVMLFSWPSNPGPDVLFKKLQEYKRARKNARRSVLALERLMGKVAGYLDELSFGERRISLTLAVHSLGNYLMEHYVRSSDFNRETRVFDNILLNQADADNKEHAQWLERMSRDTRVYVTINERDKVLRFSDKVNPPRLGNTVRGLNADGVSYMDFTQGKGVGDSHRPWHSPGKANPAVHAFFQAVFHGMRGEQVAGWVFDRGDNVYRLAEREASQTENPFLDV